MSFEFHNSIITKRRMGTSEDPFLSLSEEHTITKSTVQLSEIPDSFEKVTVSGNSTTWIEQTSGAPSENNYVVDYDINLVTFHSSRNGLQLQFDFKGTGMHYIPSSMIYSQLDENNNVVETIQTVAETTSIILESENTRINNENIRLQQEALRVSGYVDMINTSKMILKASVSTYSALATTYPNPLIYWTVRVIDTGKLYRFDGVDWVWIDTLNISIYDILLEQLVGDFDCGIFNDGNTEITIDCGIF